MLIIKFEKGGKTTMSPTGYPGTACTAVTGHYQKYMAGDKVADAATPEMYEEPSPLLNPCNRQSEGA